MNKLLLFLPAMFLTKTLQNIRVIGGTIYDADAQYVVIDTSDKNYWEIEKNRRESTCDCGGFCCGGWVCNLFKICEF